MGSDTKTKDSVRTENNNLTHKHICKYSKLNTRKLNPTMYSLNIFEEM